MDGWKIIKEETDLLNVNVICGALHAENIDTALINKKDSSYVFLGRYEIYIREEDEERALTIIKDIEDRDYEAELDVDN